MVFEYRTCSLQLRSIHAKLPCIAVIIIVEGFCHAYNMAANICAYHIPASAHSWRDVKRVILPGQLNGEGQTEYRFSMYSHIECDAIETMVFKRTWESTGVRSCAFLVWDEDYNLKDKPDNILLQRLGLTTKGSAIIVGGTRLQNRRLYGFTSLPDDYLAPQNVGNIQRLIVAGWIFQRQDQQVPDIPSTFTLYSQEHAWEWHEQHKLIQQNTFNRLHGLFPHVFPFNRFREIFISNSVCGNCGKADVRLKKCGRCRIGAYCSKNCQNLHWKLHRSFCKEFRMNDVA